MPHNLVKHKVNDFVTIYSFNQCLQGTYGMSDTILGPGITAANKRCNVGTRAIYSWWEGEEKKNVDK